VTHFLQRLTEPREKSKVPVVLKEGDFIQIGLKFCFEVCLGVGRRGRELGGQERQERQERQDERS
jgi:hypothetical protein